MRVTKGVVQVTPYHVARACIVIRRGDSSTEDIALLKKSQGLIASCIKVASTSQDSVTSYYRHHMVQ